MKTSIYYFTGTGNSLVVARDIAEKLGDTELIPINKTDKIKGDRIGVVFPVYMFGLPLIVKRFLEKLKTGKYIFAVATCGGMAGGTINKVRNILHKNNMKLDAGFVVDMPGNYIPMYGAKPKKVQDKLFSKEKEKTELIAKYVISKKTGRYDNNNIILRTLFSSIIYNLASNKIPKYDKNFWADDNCNGCRICEKVCPVKNIKMEDDKPVWQGHCEQCFACLQWCPKEAIQYGKNTKTRKRYHHPDVSLKDMIS